MLAPPFLCQPTLVSFAASLCRFAAVGFFGSLLRWPDMEGHVAGGRDGQGACCCNLQPALALQLNVPFFV